MTVTSVQNVSYLSMKYKLEETEILNVSIATSLKERR